MQAQHRDAEMQVEGFAEFCVECYVIGEVAAHRSNLFSSRFPVIVIARIVGIADIPLGFILRTSW